MLNWIAHIFGWIPGWLDLPESWYELYIVRSIKAWASRGEAIGKRGSDPESDWDKLDSTDIHKETETEKEKDKIKFDRTLHL